MEALLTLIIGGGLVAYVFVWYDGYTKQRDESEREREQAISYARDQSERVGASREQLRIALDNHFRQARTSAERDEHEHADWITEQTAEVERSTDEAWQQSPVLAPLHRHWWRLVDAATLYIATTNSDETDQPAVPADLDSLAAELAENDDLYDLDDTDRYEHIAELIAELVDELFDDDDRETQRPSTEYLHEALLAAIASLAQHRPNDATLIERALAGQADIPEFFCGATHLAAILDTIGDTWPERHPEFAREPFQSLH